VVSGSLKEGDAKRYRQGKLNYMVTFGQKSFNIWCLIPTVIEGTFDMEELY
jgi:hypothetical protein